jgi:hypothetical protein
VRHAILGLFLIASTAAHAATAYRVTTVTKDRLKRPPLIAHVIADGENRRLTYENQEEPFSEDVMLSTDGGKTVSALNTSLRTWFAVVDRPPSETGLPPSIPVKIKDTKVTVAEEPSTETIAGYPVRKFVIRAGYTAREDYGGTRVNRVHTMTEIIWTTDKLDGSLAFPMPRVTIGVRAIDAELRQKTASISGFLFRDVKTISRAYEGGAPSLEMMTTDVDDIRTVPSPAATQFVKPAGYVNQAPIIGVPGK